MQSRHFVTITKASDQRLIASKVGVADTSLRRMVGLLGRSDLGSEQGLWIKPCSGVHTLGMRFPIDVVGLDADFCVVRLWPLLKAHRITAIVPAVRTVLELASGRITHCELRPGDRLHIREYEVT
ncbi:DUF192 domain-containing protein [Terriglobus sp. RCC_193]|uniref:DUF192 domain-containing protein n=1 Tax=Terriglobus sp. RCC_193 TaxID=3239218 RepID=UPI003526A5B6